MVAQFRERRVAIEGVVIKVDLGVDALQRTILSDDEWVDLHQLAVIFRERLHKRAHDAGKATAQVMWVCQSSKAS